MTVEEHTSINNPNPLAGLVSAPWLDHYLSLGSAVQAVNTVMCDHPEIELRISSGRITLFRDGVELGIADTTHVEFQADEWYWVLRQLA